jgi:UDP-N-acetylmuramoylalanine--D-glutamate ligase
MTPNTRLKKKSFLVYGLGSSGQSVIKFFKKNNFKNFKVYDDKEKKLFKNYRTISLKKTLKQVNYIILSPGISLIKNKILRKFKKKIITDIDLFFLTNKKFKSIVVTGTNGKSTTCKLLEHILKKSKFKSLLGGNIGMPILDLKGVKKDTYVIIEASSFQLSHSKFICPDFALFLNLSNDHLDWHGNKKNYLESKLKIFQHQKKSQYAIINKKLKKNFLKKNFLSKLIIPNYEDYRRFKYKIKNDYLTSNINDENMIFVYSLVKLLKIKKNLFLSAMKSFKGLSHRFEIFLKKKNITFIDDSKATSFTSSKLALSSLKNIYWILGGLPKRGDKFNVSKFKKNISKCYIIGNHANFFKNQIKGKLPFFITKNLNNSLIKILKDLNIQDQTNKTVLLSPAAASYDQFINFEVRGKEFKRLSKLYGKKFI